METELDMVVSTERVQGNGISKAENLDDLIEDTELIDAVVLDWMRLPARRPQQRLQKRGGLFDFTPSSMQHEVQTNVRSYAPVYQTQSLRSSPSTCYSARKNTATTGSPLPHT